METLNSQMDFSVIVCCYNPNLVKLKKTLCSIFNQVGISFEVIIADDGSKVAYYEGLVNWINSNTNSIVKYSFLKENQGTVKNISEALKMAAGKYVKLISPADYLFDEHTLKCIFDAMEKNKAIVSFGNSIYYNADEKFETFQIKCPIINYKYDCIINPKKIVRNLYYFNDYILGALFSFERTNYVKYIEKLLSRAQNLA